MRWGTVCVLYVAVTMSWCVIGTASGVGLDDFEAVFVTEAGCGAADAAVAAA